MKMKRFLALALSAILILLSACSFAPAPTPTVDPDSPESRAAADMAEATEKAAEAIEQVRRDDLSKETLPFDGEEAALPADISEDDERYYYAAIDAIVAGMPEDLSAYDEYRYLAFVLCNLAQYDYSENTDGHNMTAYGAICEGAAVCLGYANAMYELCRASDLKCDIVTGFARHNNEEHGWNLVYLSDGSYYVDVTWCDQYGAPGTQKWQKAFMRTEEVFQKDHGIWEGGPATGETEY